MDRRTKVYVVMHQGRELYAVSRSTKGAMKMAKEIQTPENEPIIAEVHLYA